MLTIPAISKAASAAGLTFRDCGRGHYQLIGGSNLVNFYVTPNGAKIYVIGERKGRFVRSAAEVIAATGVVIKQRSKPEPQQTIFGELRAELRGAEVVLSRDIVSLECDDKQKAMRVFLLLEQLTECGSQDVVVD